MKNEWLPVWSIVKYLVNERTHKPVSRQQIYRLIHNGKLKAAKFGKEGKTTPYFVSTLSLRDYLKKRKRSGRPFGT